METPASPIYLRAAAQISVQEPLCDQWVDQPHRYTEPFHQALEANYKAFLDPIAGRRMGMILKRAMATSLTVTQQSGIACPDAIITGTGLGCILNTEKFLTALVNEGESFLQPTFFINSTHNTISAHIAVRLKCHGYNSTYVHVGVSFESALFDAFLQLQTGRIQTALVGGHDEMTPSYYALLQRVGFWEGAMASETAVSFMLSRSLPDTTADQTTAQASPHWHNPRLQDMEILHMPTQEQIARKATAMCAKAGKDVAKVPTITPQDVEPLFGRSFTSGAFGLYMAATYINKGYSDVYLIFNNYRGQEASIILLTS